MHVELFTWAVTHESPLGLEQILPFVSLVFLFLKRPRQSRLAAKGSSQVLYYIY